jgi:hypothetical protein
MGERLNYSAVMRPAIAALIYDNEIVFVRPIPENEEGVVLFRGGS